MSIKSWRIYQWSGDSFDLFSISDDDLWTGCPQPPPGVLELIIAVNAQRCAIRRHCRQRCHCCSFLNGAASRFTVSAFHSINFKFNSTKLIQLLCYISYYNMMYVKFHYFNWIKIVEMNQDSDCSETAPELHWKWPVINEMQPRGLQPYEWSGRGA